MSQTQKAQKQSNMSIELTFRYSDQIDFSDNKISLIGKRNFPFFGIKKDPYIKKKKINNMKIKHKI